MPCGFPWIGQIAKPFLLTADELIRGGEPVSQDHNCQRNGCGRGRPRHVREAPQHIVQDLPYVLTRPSKLDRRIVVDQRSSAHCVQPSRVELMDCAVVPSDYLRCPCNVPVSAKPVPGEPSTHEVVTLRSWPVATSCEPFRAISLATVLKPARSLSDVVPTSERHHTLIPLVGRRTHPSRSCISQGAGNEHLYNGACCGSRIE